MSIKLSVIVPVYNVENYLNKCVDSILRQNYKNVEIILIDDGSTDKSSMICDDYKNKYTNIHVIHKKNGGLSSARNAGLDVCTGDYISFIDSDDWIEQEMYNVMVNRAVDTNSDIVIAGRYRVDSNNNKVKETYMLYPELETFSNIKGLAYLMSFRGYDMSVCDKIFSKNVIKKIRFPEGKTCEDSFTTYKFFANANRIAYLEVPFYNYFFRDNSITRNSNVNKTVIEATKEQRQFIREKYPQLNPEADSSYVFAFLSVFNECIKRNQTCVDLVSYRRITKKLLKSIAKNKNISQVKKMQVVLFAYCTKLYKLIIRSRS